MKFRMTSLTIIAALALTAPAAFAQPERQTAVSLAGGIASGASDTGVALGGSVLVDLTERLSIEGQGTYLARGAGALCPAPGTGFGFGHGPGMGAGAGACPASATGYWGVGAMPTFYARRLGPMAFPHNGAWETRSFSDPALSVGGGVRIDVTDRLVLRPDLRALVVFRDGQRHTLGVFVVNLGYRF